jgi:hypothetical protein
MSNFRLNWVAILVAAIVSFLFEALWFSAFMTQWLTGIGRTKEWLMSAAGYNPALLTVCIQASGEQTARRGVLCAAVIWFGFIATSWATEYIFEVRTLQIYAINTGYLLFDLMIIGAIVGAWKKKSPPALS